MENKNFKKLFGEIVRLHRFEGSHGGWFKESEECIIALDLQKSNFSNIFYLNIKVYIQGVFGMNYFKSKDLVKKDTGDIFSRQPNEYNDIFDLDSPMEYELRKKRLEKLFQEVIVPETNKTLTRAGIKELAEAGMFILPAVKGELGLGE